mmetsp:Transcript_7920/g.19532  ORF Transcript_7920/g.19532 Transcript_7920/m.19532 type:complete len:243 (-) Transcript_7920:19-747(-)
MKHLARYSFCSDSGCSMARHRLPASSSKNFRCTAASAVSAARALSFRAIIRSKKLAAYECTTFDSAARSPTTVCSCCPSTSLGSCDRKVITNLRQSALRTGKTSVPDCSSGQTCSWKNWPMLTSWLVEVAPSAAVFPLTVRAMIRYMAQSLDFQCCCGFAAYSCRRTLMYCEQSAVTRSGNLSVRDFTSSQALLRRVSLSLPSMSLRMYSMKFISKSSSSSSRIRKLGMITPSQICFSVPSS